MLLKCAWGLPIGIAMAHPNLVGGLGAPVGPFAMGGRLAIGIGAFLAVGLVALPIVVPDISHLPALLVVVVALFAVKFALRGGIVAASVATGIAAVWLLQDQPSVHGFADFLARAAAFALIGGVVGSVVSERRRYEVAVTAHNEMSLELISTSSFDGYFTRLNPAWTGVLGWELHELMGQPFANFIHPDDLANTAPEVVRETLAGLPVFNFQNRYRCRDGSYRWLEWTSRSDPSAKLLYAVARDITERKATEQALESFHEALEAAVRERTSELQQRTRELDESRSETLRRLALAAEYRDDQTYEHTERVGRMAAELAQRLGIPGPQVALLRLAAPLHDVGKLGLSDTILLKPGKLTHDEMTEVKKHPADGARILANSNSDVLQLAEQIALSHHEWWDGSGYPHGLKGDEIPQCGRIVAVADVYDALTHIRPYKSAWPIQQALDEIHSLSGTQFDPEIVEALLILSRPQLIALNHAERIHAVA